MILVLLCLASVWSNILSFNFAGEKSASPKPHIYKMFVVERKSKKAQETFFVTHSFLVICFIKEPENGNQTGLLFNETKPLATQFTLHERSYLTSVSFWLFVEVKGA